MSSDGWPDEEEQEAPRQPDLKFGKHRGKEIDDPSIPVDYLQWLVDDTKGERPVKSDWMIKRPTTTTSEHPVNENTTPATPARDTRLLLLLQDCVNRLTRIEAHLGVKAGQQIPLEDDEVF